MLIRGGMGQQLSGSVGGVTASRNRYGAYLRNRTVPVNPNTPRQLEVRAAFAAATLAWKGLTDLQRGAWTAYADQTPVLNRLGESITLSGIAMFSAVNSFRLAAGSAVLTVAPSTPGLSTLGTASNFDAVIAAYAFVTVGATATGPAIVSYSPPVSAGAQSYNGPFSLFSYSTMTATGIPLVTQASFRYGAPLSGEYRYFRVRAMSADGRLSNTFIQRVQITV